MSSVRRPVTIPVQPWFADHRFYGRVIFPAVETMQLLAAAVARSCPDVDVRVMEQLTFPKFLELDPGQTSITGEIELDTDKDGPVRAVLRSRVRLKACTQLQTHGSGLFPRAVRADTIDSVKPWVPLSEPVAEVTAERVYQDLVPFGPHYQSLRGTVLLYDQGAAGILRAPARLPADTRAYRLLGSPFPLDGALHAACVYGQRCCDFIPFPVGFARRVVPRPTITGERYRTRIELVSRTDEELVVNLWILTEDEQVCEAVTGVRMRDVSKGTIKPPAWIKA